tara:strand:- start:131 stop:316 length:186 start_codon:yes stop_codon:yes gene_type:complete
LVFTVYERVAAAVKHVTLIDVVTGHQSQIETLTGPQCWVTTAAVLFVAWIVVWHLFAVRFR